MQSSVSEVVGCKSNKRRSRCNRLQKSVSCTHSATVNSTGNTNCSRFIQLVIKVRAKTMRNIRQMRNAHVTHFGLKAFCLTQSLLFVILLFNLLISASNCVEGVSKNANGQENVLSSDQKMDNIPSVEVPVDLSSANILDSESAEATEKTDESSDGNPTVNLQSRTQPNAEETGELKEVETKEKGTPVDPPHALNDGVPEVPPSSPISEDANTKPKSVGIENATESSESAKVDEDTEKKGNHVDENEVAETKEDSKPKEEIFITGSSKGDVISDSQRIIQELLEDSKEADENVPSTDSNVAAPRVVSNSTFNVDNLAKTPTNLSGTDSSEEEDMKRKNAKEEDMKTFHEWKQKVIEEQQQQQQKENNHNGGGHDDKHGSNGFQNHQQGPTNGSPLHFIKQQFTENFASADCGAKVLDASPDAQSRGAILQTDRDKYMNMPCDEPKKFVVIELCEPIQLKLVDIGTFELFSSLIENFTVLVSDRHPSREWKSLGNFTAKNERSVQSFPISDVMYYKYVRIEYLSHYGKEHYCPVSAVKVFGLTIEVEDEEVVNLMEKPFKNENDEPMVNEAQNSADNKEQTGKNVLSTVTDAMAKIANKFIGGSRSPEEKESTGNMTEPKTDNSSVSDEKSSSSAAKPEDIVHPLPQRPGTSGAAIPAQIVIDGNSTSNIEPPQIKSAIRSPQSLRDAISAISATIVYKRLIEKEKCAKLPVVLCDEDFPMLLLVEKFRYMYISSVLTFQCCLPNHVLVAMNCNASKLEKSPNESSKGTLDFPNSNKTPEKVNLATEASAGDATLESEKENGANPDAAASHPPAVEEVITNIAKSPPSSANDEVPPVGSTAQKESLIMRLRNKVRELEFNMSLSSEYLEELSRRYKKQMDDITAKHNKTLTALISTNEEAASRDVKHSQRISELEDLNFKLEAKIDNMERVINHMNNSLVYKHILMILTEFLIFLVIVFLVFWRSGARLLPRSYDNSVQQIGSEGLPIRGRSRSEHRISERSDSTIVKRSYSELNLQSVEDLIVPPATPFRAMPSAVKTVDDIFTSDIPLNNKGVGRRKKSKQKRRLFSAYEFNNSTSNIRNSYTNLGTDLSRKIHTKTAQANSEEQSRRECLSASKALSVI